MKPEIQFRFHLIIYIKCKSARLASALSEGIFKGEPTFKIDNSLHIYI